MRKGTNRQLLTCLLAITGTAGAQTLRLPAGDADRGRRVISEEGCLRCHHAGLGARAPDLLRARGRGFSPFMLAGEMWNHAPAMWTEMRKTGIRLPRLEWQQAADLFAFLFSMQSFEEPGNPARGKALFQHDRCGGCHSPSERARNGISSVRAWGRMEDAADLAQLGSWHIGRRPDHGRESADPRLRVSAQEMRDVAAYVRTVGSPIRAPAPPEVASRGGAELLAGLGCTQCHSAGRSLTRGRTRYGISEFAAALWRHGPMGAGSIATRNSREMRALLQQMVALQFLDEIGDRDRGELVFAQKRCDACHGPEPRVGPDLAVHRGRLTSYEMMSVLWKHGPKMLHEMKLRGIPWPRFRDDEMADIAAYLHGPSFKLRDEPSGAGRPIHTAVTSPSSPR